MRWDFWNSASSQLGSRRGKEQLTGKEPVPVLFGELWILCQLSSDHEFLDSVDRVDVVHAVDDDASDFLQSFVGPHGGDGIPLNEDVAVCEKLDRLRDISLLPVDASDMKLTLSVLPFGPTIRCLRLTKRSLFRTMPPILIISQAMPSCKIFSP